MSQPPVSTTTAPTQAREGSLDAPTRHPLDWKNPAFFDQAALDAELDVLEETDTPPVTIAPLEPTPVDASDPLAAAIARLQSTPFSLDQLLAETEQSYIEAALRLSNGNVSRAARLLGINRTTLYNRMESAARET